MLYGCKDCIVGSILCSSSGANRIPLHVCLVMYMYMAIKLSSYHHHHQEKKLDVAEMGMLRWMSGVTKLDRIRNEINRGTTKVGDISKKVQESRLKRYGHVLRREDEYVGE